MNSIKPVLALAQRELRSWFITPVGYVYLVFFVALANGLFFVLNRFFDVGQVSMRGWFGMLPWVYLFFVPAFSMGLWSEEKGRGTIETLLTLPLSEWQAVWGKFLAGLGFLALSLACTFTVPYTLSQVGNLDWGATLASYFGAFLMGAAFLAVGLLVSSLTRNQVVAFILSITVLFALIMVGHPQMIMLLSARFAHLSFFSSVVHWLSWSGLITHFGNISRGVIDTRDVIYSVVVVMALLHLNVHLLRTQRWK